MNTLEALKSTDKIQINAQTIERKIARYKKSIKKFKDDDTLDDDTKKRAIFNMQCLIRELKWVMA
jgi:hypothetical protein